MYRRRLIVFLLIVVGVTLACMVRLASLQLGRGDEFRAKAEKVLTHGQVLPAPRGTIYDRRNNQLAAEVSSWDFCLDYNMLTDQPQYLARQVRRLARLQKPKGALSQSDLDAAEPLYRQRVQRTWQLAEEITGWPRNRLSQAVDEAVRRTEQIRRRVGPVKGESELVIVPGLEDAAAQRLRNCLDQMVGSSVLRSHKREYFAGRLACHAIGLIGPVSAKERQAAEEATSRSADESAWLDEYLPGDISGKSGVEKLCEDRLRGRRGYLRQRRTGETIEGIPAQSGQDVHLTLDIELEKILSEVLAQTDGPEPRTGSIVVIDVPTGEILAMVSLPDYDLGSFSQDFPRLVTDEKYLPLMNRSVAALYPPGSTNKVLGALAALSSGVMTPSTSFTCTGTYEGLHCLGTHGTISLQTAIQHSCNVYFYNVGRLVGLGRFEAFLRQLNYGQRPGCLLPEERPGLLPDLASAGGGEALQMGIGQGGLAVTPLHVANAMATIARDGEFRTPVIVRELAGLQQRRNLNIPPSALAVVKEGMRLVVNSPGGTAYSTAYDDEIEISGKTGTAKTEAWKVDMNHNGRIDPDEIRQGDTAWFAGYAPSRRPRIAFAVVVEYTTEHGGKACGPLARHVAHACRKLGYLD